MYKREIKNFIKSIESENIEDLEILCSDIMNFIRKDDFLYEEYIKRVKQFDKIKKQNAFKEKLGIFCDFAQLLYEKSGSKYDLFYTDKREDLFLGFFIFFMFFIFLIIIDFSSILLIGIFYIFHIFYILPSQKRPKIFRTLNTKTHTNFAPFGEYRHLFYLQAWFYQTATTIYRAFPRWMFSDAFVQIHSVSSRVQNLSVFCISSRPRQQVCTSCRIAAH